ncbi:hypothetical protein BIV57_15670 [Mangrovactinospora gilvigrisea]|uniref:Diacylglycerol kinase n=1 Tax=Mangrovactinospora gilvigrisea TaxID=1428644 RepID=A0A1J7BDD3_9ACTN|nr:hypothetical protein [Mangrovactinospora gilvigrisea]OIV36589.1 hypothetical protein BIV57_15670 [Mangrovactinospora gilvigrisea]
MQALLVVIDPAARRVDGEAVRVARDVLGAGARVKITIPEDTAELEHTFAHRGPKRPVLVGDDTALRRVVELLWRRGELGEAGLAVVPVGEGPRLRLVRSLGVPPSPVRAARAALGDVERRLDLLVDDGGGVALGTLRVRPTAAALLARRGVRVSTDGGGEAGLRGAFTAVDEAPDDGVVEVRVHGQRVRARQVRVRGGAFRYGVGGGVRGPVPERTWTVHPAAWTLRMPA